MASEMEDDPVGPWLIEVGLEYFAATFKREGFEGEECLAELRELTAQQLVALAGSFEPERSEQTPSSTPATPAPSIASPAPSTTPSSGRKAERRKRGGCCAAPAGRG